MVFLSTRLNILSFGITINVSTLSFIFLMPSSQFVNLFFPSKLNGLVTTQIVNIPISLAIPAMMGAAPVPVHQPNPQVIKTMSASLSICLITSLLSSAALRPISGSVQAPNHFVTFMPILILFVARLFDKSCASVLMAINSTQVIHSATILLTALLPAHPTPITLILAPDIRSGLNSAIVMKE